MTEGLSSGLLIKPVANLQRRQRSTYYRLIPVEGGEPIWVQTGLLPSDTLGREQYLSKGFRLTLEGVESAKPQVEAIEEKDKQIDILVRKIVELEGKVKDLADSGSKMDKSNPRKKGKQKRKKKEKEEVK